MINKNGSSDRPTAMEAAWGRVFAQIYDPAFLLAERRGLRQLRRNLVGRAEGSVLELGAGTGLNLRHYPPAVSEIVLAEPDPHMAAKLRKRASASQLDTSVVEAPAESLPFDDATFDTVVATLVFCTGANPGLAVAEVARVLRPGGAFLFAEHVRSPSPRAARWQDRLNLPWSWYACGCQCNRDTLSTFAAALEVRELRRDRLRWISPVVRPLLVGTATPIPVTVSVVSNGSPPPSEGTSFPRQPIGGFSELRSCCDVVDRGPHPAAGPLQASERPHS